MAIEFPANPSDSDSFVANNVTYIYDGTLGVWNIYSGTTYNGGFGGSGGASVTIGDSAPTSPSNGDMWWESDVGRLKIYYDDGDTAQWVDATPTSNTVGGSNSVIAPTAIGIINGTSGTGTGLSWGNWDAVAGTLDITFDNAQPDANYAVVSDGEFQDDGRHVSVQNKTTTGFEISLYDGSGNVNTPSALNLFTIIVYASTPTQLVQTNPYSDGNVDSHLNVSGATTGEVLSWTGTDYDWVTAASGGASVTTSDTAPSNPSEGDLWYDTTELTTYVYYNDGDSSQWVNASPNGMSASLNISDTAPTNPSDGDLWFDSTTLKTFVYYNDGSSSQWVTLVPTAGGTGGGVTTYADTATLVQESPDAGSLGYVTANNNLYLYNGSGWSKVDTTNSAPVINSVQDASANTTPFSFATDGTPTVITVDATDPEGFPLTYSYSVTSGSLGTTATVTQGTGAQSNEFTLTPGTNDPADVGTFELTFSVTDGVETSTSVADFSLAFFTPWYGDRGLLQYQQNATPYTEYAAVVDITTNSNATYWGDLTVHGNYTSAASDATIGVWNGAGLQGPMSYMTFATQGNSVSFGDGNTFGNVNSAHNMQSNGTYGMIMGGYQSNATPQDGIPQGYVEVIQRFTFAQTSTRPTDHGNLRLGGTFYAGGGISSATKSFILGGSTDTINYVQAIDTVSFATPSNSTQFGNMSVGAIWAAGLSDETRGVYALGYTGGHNNIIEYVTMDTPSNATDFGDLQHTKRAVGATNNATRGIFWGGYSGSVWYNNIDVITIQTTGNASNFGSMPIAGFSGMYERQGCSGNA
jgi:hypothetical protein